MLNEQIFQTCGYQRRHHPDGPYRRGSIHDRPTCPFSAGDGALTEHQKGPSPVSCEINLRFRRFGYRTGQITGLIVYYIWFPITKCSRASLVLRPQYLINMDELPGPATISACTIAMDHNAIICFMIDGLTRGPDKDVHVPSVGSQKYPSYNVDVIYL